MTRNSFQVHAVDKDPIESGGKITYTFVVSNANEKVKFDINQDTGVITTNRHVCIFLYLS